MRVRDVMTWEVATCRPEDSLARVAEIMWTRDCGVVPVVDDAGRVHAMLTDRDICIACWSKGRAPQDVRVADVGARAPQTVQENDAIELAEARMRANQVRRLPVVDVTGRLVGILSLGDLARRVHSVPSYPHEGLGSESIALTLAVISRPHASENTYVSPSHVETSSDERASS